MERWSREYGIVLALWRSWDKLELHQLLQEFSHKSPVEFPVEEAIFGMVLNRLVDPDSKLGTYDWLKEKVFRPEFEDYFEEQGWPGLAERGYSRDKQGDLKQAIIGLMMTREGIPVAHHIFSGNTADIAIFRYAVADLRRRFTVRRVVIVADRGVVSEPLLEALDKEGMSYIAGIPLKKWKAADRVPRRDGRYYEVAENLRVKEVWDSGQRYVVCHNRERESEDAQRRAEIVAALDGILTQVGLVGLARQNGYRRYLKVRNGGQAEVDWQMLSMMNATMGSFSSGATPGFLLLR
jgi:hypothetical protein